MRNYGAAIDGSLIDRRCLFDWFEFGLNDTKVGRCCVVFPEDSGTTISFSKWPLISEGPRDGSELDMIVASNLYLPGCTSSARNEPSAEKITA
jgi:hypothetical protein